MQVARGPEGISGLDVEFDGNNRRINGSIVDAASAKVNRTHGNPVITKTRRFSPRVPNSGRASGQNTVMERVRLAAGRGVEIDLCEGWSRRK